MKIDLLHLSPLSFCHRYDKIKDVLFHAKLRHLSFESTFPLDDLDVDINFDLKLKEKGGTNQLNMQNHAFFLSGLNTFKKL